MTITELTNTEKQTYDIICKVVNGDITRKEAMFKLNKSRQQIYRLINIYYAECEKGFIHKGRGKIPHNKKIYLIIEELKKLYFDWCYYFCEVPIKEAYYFFPSRQSKARILINQKGVEQ